MVKHKIPNWWKPIEKRMIDNKERNLKGMPIFIADFENKLYGTAMVTFDLLIFDNLFNPTHWMFIPDKTEKDPFEVQKVMSSIIYSFDSILDNPRRKIVFRNIRLMKSLNKKLGINYKDAWEQISKLEDII